MTDSAGPVHKMSGSWNSVEQEVRLGFETDRSGTPLEIRLAAQDIQ